MRRLIKRHLNGKKVLILFLLTTLVYLIMILFSIPLVMNFAGGMKLLDMMPLGYDVDYVSTLLNTLGEKGRDAYLFKQIPLDMIYPFLFGITYCLILAYFLNKLAKLESSFLYLCFIPLFAGLFDYFENFGIIALLTTYPTHSIVVAELASIFSILKASFTSIYFLILIIVLIVFVWKKMFNKK